MNKTYDAIGIMFQNILFFEHCFNEFYICLLQNQRSYVADIIPLLRIRVGE